MERSVEPGHEQKENFQTQTYDDLPFLAPNPRLRTITSEARNGLSRRFSAFLAWSYERLDAIHD
jgi:hypothetical protein